MLNAVYIFFKHGNGVYSGKGEMAAVKQQINKFGIGKLHKLIYFLSCLHTRAHVMMHGEKHAF